MNVVMATATRPANVLMSYNYYVRTMTGTADLSQSRRMLILLGLLLALFLADGFITRFLVTNGFGIEGNPLLGSWVTTDQFAWVKLAGGLLACLLLWDFHRRVGRPALVVTGFFIVVFLLILYWNIAVALFGLVNL